MGQEIACRIRYQDQALAGKAYLETDHVLFRGPERLKLLFKDMKSVRAEAGVLRLEFEGGPAEFELGTAAEKWAQKILNPPSRLQKLGVKPGLSIRVIGQFEADFLEDLEAARVERPDGPVDLIFLMAAGTARLRQVRKIRSELKPDGALWVVFPKGTKTVGEVGVIEAGRDAGLKDVKVASFSITHTALKFVIPLANRPKP